MKLFGKIILATLLTFTIAVAAQANPYKFYNSDASDFPEDIAKKIALAKTAKPEHTKQLQRLEYADYIITNMEFNIPIVGEAGVDSFECIFIQKAQQEVYASCKTDSIGWYALPELSDIIDITGDNIPDLVITEYTGGASCCWGFHLFRLGEQFKYVQWLDNGKEEVTRFSFPEENDGFAITDSTYAYWEGPGYDGPSLYYWQTPVGDHFEVALESFTRPRFTKAAFAKAIAEIKQEISPDSVLPNGEMRRHVIELATSGHLIHALDLAKAVWPQANNQHRTLDSFLTAIANAPYESKFFREYVFLNLSSLIRQTPNNVLEFPSGIVLEQAEKPDTWQYLPGIRASADTNYFSYAAGSVALHTVRPSNQKVGDIAMTFRKSEAGFQTASLSLAKTIAASVPKSFTMAHVNNVKAANTALLYSALFKAEENRSPLQEGVYDVPLALQQLFKTDCPGATYALHLAKRNYKTYKTLKVSLPSKQNFYVPWGAQLEYLSCQAGQPVVIGILACRNKGNCGQVVSAFK
jgi:hypothetical protein